MGLIRRTPYEGVAFQQPPKAGTNRQPNAKVREFIDK
jgi:hypothetical protein